MSFPDRQPVRVLIFPPPASPAPAAPPRASREAREAAAEDRQRIFDLSRDAAGALQEIRHMVVNELGTLIESAGIDQWMLVRLLEIDKDRAEDIINKDLDEIATETLTEYLQTLVAQ